ncbi:proline-rich protein PRCC [Spea bombifrons]|uniref:proline-rich protein PRCC n=1 Tax=Spea bombifrons TaxID=233779 RepID=UPI00234A5E7C|nr:proline-rich protein PRCC [Spea bombifrons]
MSLVAYASSDESGSDSEGAPEPAARAGRLLASLPPPRQDHPPTSQAEAVAYPSLYPRQAPGEQEQHSPGFYGPPGGYGYPPAYGYGPPSYGSAPSSYPGSQGPPGYGNYGHSNSQGPGNATYSNMGYGGPGSVPTNYPPPGLNMPPPPVGRGMNLPPPLGSPGLNLPPPQGGPGMNMPPPQGGPGMNMPPPPKGGPGMNMPPPPQGGPGMNLPPQGGLGMNMPPMQGGPGIGHPPPQGGQGMNLPPPQGGAGMSIPPPKAGPGMNIPPPPQGGPGISNSSPQGMNLPPPQSGQGQNLPPPRSSHGLSLPPPHGSHGLNLPPPQGSPGLNLSIPPPLGTHGMNLPPPQVGPGLNLPPPQGGQGINIPPPQLSPTSTAGAESRLSLPPPKPSGQGINLPPPTGENPKPKKRSEPVRITVPELNTGGSDSEEDEPKKKKTGILGSREGFGLSALLPQPKNSGGDSKRSPLPYNFTKKASDAPNDAKAPKSATSSKPHLVSKSEVSHTPSPSAIKAAAKNAALQMTKQIAQEEDDESDEELAQGNFFSLSETNDVPAIGTDSFSYQVPSVNDDRSPGTETAETDTAATANAPLEFKTSAAPDPNQQWPAGAEDYSSQMYAQYPEYSDSAAGYYPDYYGSGYYQESESSAPDLREPAASNSFMDDEAFKRLQGKRNRGREEINFVEIKGDDQLSGNQQWLAKSLTEEKNMKSFSKKKGEQPTGQQRRKHQITYLIHQAKERELELKNTWSDNKLSRRQTQAKYGF